MIEQLEKIGLSRVEAKVYLALVDLGASFAGGIIAKTKQHRQQVYEALDKLAARHLISVSQKQGKQYFQVANPQELFTLVREQEAVLEEIVPVLKEKFKAPQEEVVVYRDIEGYQRALENRITATSTGGHVCVIGGTGEEFYDLTKHVFEKYVSGLEKKKIGIKWVIYKSQWQEFTKHFGRYVGRLHQARVLDQSQALPVATIVLQDRIQISLFYPRPTMIEIINESLAKEYKRYFDMLWRQAGDE